jgi:hypothetical protein
MRGPNTRILAGLGVLLLLVAACGGSGSGADGGGGSASEPAGGAVTTPEPAASDAGGGGTGSEETAPPVDPPAGGGGTAGDACQLVTADELERVFGGSGYTLQVIEGVSQTCDIQRDSAPFMAISLIDDPQSAGPIYEAWATDAGATTIGGLGDRAVYAPTNAILVIQHGERVVSLALFDDGTTTEDERIQKLTEIGGAVAGRL